MPNLPRALEQVADAGITSFAYNAEAAAIVRALAAELAERPVLLVMTAEEAAMAADAWDRETRRLEGLRWVAPLQARSAFEAKAARLRALADRLAAAMKEHKP